MLKHQTLVSAVILACVLSSRSCWAQGGPVGGLYEITAGTYSECCGIAGNDFGFFLPSKSQKYVRFTADASRHVATLTPPPPPPTTPFAPAPPGRGGAARRHIDVPGRGRADRLQHHAVPAFRRHPLQL